MAPVDEKYIVFKRDEWDRFAREVRDTDEAFFLSMGPPPIDDAVVIRRQDVFAPAALHAYGDNIATVERLARRDQPQLAERLSNIASYFKDQALAAEVEAHKLPD